MRQIVLGSGSPRRRELLRDFYRLKIIVPEVDESPRRSESVRAYLSRIVRAKYKDVQSRIQNSHVILCADTCVAMNEKLYLKPGSRKEAEKFLKSFSDNTHQVITAVAVGKSGLRPRVRLLSTSVRFRKLKESEIRRYLSSGEWKGKAGAYAIQGEAAQMVAQIRGSLTNVIGLPLEESLQMLEHSFSQA